MIMQQGQAGSPVPEPNALILVLLALAVLVVAFVVWKLIRSRGR